MIIDFRKHLVSQFEESTHIIIVLFFKAYMILDYFSTSDKSIKINWAILSNMSCISSQIIKLIYIYWVCLIIYYFKKPPHFLVWFSLDVPFSVFEVSFNDIFDELYFIFLKVELITFKEIINQSCSHLFMRPAKFGI